MSAEIGQAHEGSLGTALAYVKAIAAAGADCAKFQDHWLDKCNRFRPGTERDFPQDINRQAYWRRTSLSVPDWKILRRACRDEGIEYIVSCFSMDAFKCQAELEPDRWKIASSKVNDHELIDACVRTGKPVVVSGGMSHCDELEAAVARIPSQQLLVLACVSLYPCPPEKVDMGGNDSLINGISDHSGTIWPSICAAAYSYQMAEVHVVFNRECFGPDVASSITTAELRQLVEGVRFIDRLDEGPTRQEVMAELKEMREVFGVA